MDSKEDILSALDEFSHQNADKVPPLLERYLNKIAATGETLFAWPKLRPLFLYKLESVMKEFFEKVPTDDLPTCPNVENVKFEEIRERLVMTIKEFNGAPFTIQRLCELITNPWKHYKRTDKFMRGIEKNLLVVSTVDPYGNKIVNETTKVLVNGLDANGYETDKMCPGTPERSFFPPPAPCSSPNTNGTTLHGMGDASTSGSSSPSSSWFASSSAGDTPCQWGGGPASATMVDSSCTQDDSSGSATTQPSPTEPAPSSRTTSDAGPHERILPVHNTDISESSSESSGSGSSEHSTPPPLGDIDKDSEDSNESAKTSGSSSPDSSLNEAEAEQHSHAEQTCPIEHTTDVATAEVTPESVPVDPVTTSVPEEGSSSETVTVPKEPADSEINTEDLRECTKRSIDQDHTETQNKRPRMENSDVSQSSHVESSSELEASESLGDNTVSLSAEPIDTDVVPSLAPAADSQSEDKPEKPAAMEDNSLREAQPAEVQEGRDSQDSQGFDAIVDSDCEAAHVEESVLSSLKTDEETATSSTTTETESMDSDPTPDNRVTAEAVSCEVSASDETVHNNTPEKSVEDHIHTAIPHTQSASLPEEPSVSSATCEQKESEQDWVQGAESSKLTDETMPEPESTSQSEDITQISQSEDVCHSSLQEGSMDVN